MGVYRQRLTAKVCQFHSPLFICLFTCTACKPRQGFQPWRQCYPPLSSASRTWLSRDNQHVSTAVSRAWSYIPDISPLPSHGLVQSVGPGWNKIVNECVRRWYGIPVWNERMLSRHCPRNRGRGRARKWHRHSSCPTAALHLPPQKPGTGWFSQLISTVRCSYNKNIWSLFKNIWSLFKNTWPLYSIQSNPINNLVQISLYGIWWLNPH